MAHDPTVRSLQYWLAYVLPILRIPEFALGGCIAIAVRNGWILRVHLLPSLVALVLAYVASLFLPSLWSQRAVLVIPCVLIIASLASTNVAGKATAVRNGWLRLGEWSFAFYLFHYPIIECFSRIASEMAITNEFWRAGIVSLAALMISLFASFLLYQTIENPLVRLLGRYKYTPISIHS